jgi:hypothetical protein
MAAPSDEPVRVVPHWASIATGAGLILLSLVFAAIDCALAANWREPRLYARLLLYCVMAGVGVAWLAQLYSYIEFDGIRLRACRLVTRRKIDYRVQDIAAVLCEWEGLSRKPSEGGIYKICFVDGAVLELSAGAADHDRLIQKIEAIRGHWPHGLELTAKAEAEGRSRRSPA